MSGYVLTAAATLGVWLAGFMAGWRARTGKNPVPSIAEMLPAKAEAKPAPVLKPQVKA